MLRRLIDAPRPGLTILVDGSSVAAREGESVAAAMLSAGHLVTRASPVSGLPRAPYCLMGACFECLVAIDGVDNRQACMAQVRPGMRIETGRGKRNLGP